MLISKPTKSLGDRRQVFFPWATLIIAVTVLVVALIQQTMNWELAAVSEWLFVPAEFSQQVSQWSWDTGLLTPLTSTVFHAGWLHLGGNLIFLFLFAFKLERWIKPFWLIVSFLVCGSLANLAILLTDTDGMAPIIGLSGAVSSLMGLLFALAPLARIGVILPLGIYLQMIRIPIIALVGAWLLLQLGYWLNSSTITVVAWWTHIGGFLIGCTLALLLRLFGYRVKH